MTDLHKGTHNCAAAIRESGAGISSPSLAPPTPAFLHPRSGSQPPQPTSPPTTPVGASKGAGGGQKHGHSVSTLLSFFHTSGRRRRWFLGGTTRLLLSPSPLLPHAPLLAHPPPPSFAPRSPQPGRSCSHHHLPFRTHWSAVSPFSFFFFFSRNFRILSKFALREATIFIFTLNLFRDSREQVPSLFVSLLSFYVACKMIVSQDFELSIDFPQNSSTARLRTIIF